LNILEGQLDLISNSFYKKYLLDSFEIGKVKFPKVLFGSSPFFGAGQFKERSMIYHDKFYLNPPNITQLYQESILRGLNAIHVPSDPVIIHAIAEAIRSTFIDNFVLATVEVRNLQEELNLCELIKAQSIGQIVSAQGIAVKQEGLRQGYAPRIKGFFGRFVPGRFKK